MTLRFLGILRRPFLLLRGRPKGAWGQPGILSGGTLPSGPTGLVLRHCPPQGRTGRWRGALSCNCFFKEHRLLRWRVLVTGSWSSAALFFFS